MRVSNKSTVQYFPFKMDTVGCWPIFPAAEWVMPCLKICSKHLFCRLFSFPSEKVKQRSSQFHGKNFNFSSSPSMNLAEEWQFLLVVLPSSLKRVPSNSHVEIWFLQTDLINVQITDLHSFSALCLKIRLIKSSPWTQFTNNFSEGLQNLNCI